MIRQTLFSKSHLTIITLHLVFSRQKRENKQISPTSIRLTHIASTQLSKVHSIIKSVLCLATRVFFLSYFIVDELLLNETVSKTWTLTSYSLVFRHSNVLNTYQQIQNRIKLNLFVHKNSPFRENQISLSFSKLENENDSSTVQTWLN